MEPKFSLSAYTTGVCFGVIGLALRGFPGSAAVVSAAIALIGLGLFGSYRWSASRASRRLRWRRLMPHRTQLDRVVLCQLMAIAAAGGLSAAICAATSSAPAAHASAVVQAVTLGVVVVATAVYLSALLDWFWVLPKISGITREPPCVRPGGEKWSSVTGIWLAHRAVATIIVTVVLAALPGWLAVKTGQDATMSAGFVVLGTALGIAFNTISGNSGTALRQAWNPRIRVGDSVLLRPKVTDELARAFVIDVSVQGAKYRVPADLQEADMQEDPVFRSKGKQLSAAAVAELDALDDAASTEPICENLERCRAVYWYCCRNPEAHARNDDASATRVNLEETLSS